MRWVVIWGLTCVCCGGFGGDAPCSVAAGELVITELGVRGDSYVEIYGDVATDLAALSLSVAGSGAARASPLSGRIAAGEYLTQPVRALADGGGALTLSCGSAVVDIVSYAAVKSAVVALDGSVSPDATANDDLSLWCAQVGTPGGPNDPCMGSDCSGRPPDVGELVIAGVFANPEGVDAGLEWVRLYVTADDEVSLAGLTLVHTQADGRSRHWTLSCDSGESGDVLQVQPDGLALYNATGTTLSLQRGDTIIDSAALPSLVAEGLVAVLRDAPSANANDDPSAFCLVDDGAADGGCAVVEPGDVLISEVLRDPAGADTGHEWIELYAATDVSIGGLAVTEAGSSTRRWVVSASASVQVGSLVVLPVGGDADPHLDGAATLFNDAATLSLFAGDVVIDSALIDCGVNGTSCGRASSSLASAFCEIDPPSPGEENTCRASPR
jgi:hypothetical protein